MAADSRSGISGLSQLYKQVSGSIAGADGKNQKSLGVNFRKNQQNSIPDQLSADRPVGEMDGFENSV
jgi:hypothetical protein